MAITKDTELYYCEHMQKALQENPLAKAYTMIHAGESVRFIMCRLCSTVALGTIIGERIKEGINPEITERHDFV
jgi:hypothetical protein